jgi:hypothetical protein
VDPARDLAQLCDRVHQPGRDAGQFGPQVVPAGRGIGFRSAHRQGERDQPLLRAVVEVSLDPPAGLVRRGDDPPA